ncbi:trypsin-like peptidase domain-containing protein [candidate division KSB1 bacterium]|nr:trypsin-like peptidase domain-containing protein [candidate division KSB1 bacterium]
MPQPRWFITVMLAAGSLLAGLLLAAYFNLPPDTPASSTFAVSHPNVGNPSPELASTAPISAGDNSQSRLKTPNDLELAAQAFSQVAGKVIPVVVSLATTKLMPVSGSSGRGDDGRGLRFYSPRTFRQQSSGSGIILTPDGYIVTNVHVIDHAVKIVVTLHDNRSFPGKIVGMDPLTEVAVVKIEARGLPAAILGDSNQLVIGQWVLAVGNPLNLRSTVTAGIISAAGRDINIIQGDYGVENFIQTDAAINPGNSGGALVNLAGEVIGVNTAIATETGYAMGLGFAIPMNLARKIATDLMRYGKVARGYLGIALQEITEVHARALKLGAPRGVMVDDVYKDSPAQAGGLLPMDVILAIDGKPVQRMNQVQALIAARSPGAAIDLRLFRNEKEMDKRMTLGELPDNSLEVSSSNQPVRSRFKNLGIEVENVTEAGAAALSYTGLGGVLVVRVEKLSPAEESGLRADDIVAAIDRKAIRSKEDFAFRIQRLKSGAVVILTVFRRGGQYHIFIEVP